jgi:predicted O-methyltransferase YrrM
MAIHAFNEHVKNDPRTSQVLLTIRDGMLLIQKNEL